MGNLYNFCQPYDILIMYVIIWIYIFSNLQSSQVKHSPQDSINEFITRKLNSFLVVDVRFISEISTISVFLNLM